MSVKREMEHTQNTHAQVCMCICVCARVCMCIPCARCVKAWPVACRCWWARCLSVMVCYCYYEDLCCVIVIIIIIIIIGDQVTRNKNIEGEFFFIRKS